MGGGRADGGSEGRVEFGGEEDLSREDGREVVEMTVLWVIVVETLTGEFSGGVEDDGMILSGNDNTGEERLGVNEVISEAVGGSEGSLDGVFMEELTAKEAAGEGHTDSESLADGARTEGFSEEGVIIGTVVDLREGEMSEGGGTEGGLWVEGAAAVTWELGELISGSKEGGLADFLCFDLGEG